MTAGERALRWLIGTLKTPPVGSAARVEAGYRLRRLQRGAVLGLPLSRPMPRIGRGVHELRVDDRDSRSTWRILYRIDSDAIVVVHWFHKKTARTPEHVIELCRKRPRHYDG